MQEIAVIIPFFQQEPGILARALESVASQHILDGWSAEVIVVNDGSPCPAEDEVRSLRFPEPLRLKVIRQRNGGVAAARNRGLDEASPSATLIAFLDSDDVWPTNHLASAIAAYRSGFDFYFTDNRRAGYHDSHVFSHCGPEIGRFIACSQQEHGMLEIPTDFMVRVMLKELPAQASTVVYKRSIAAQLRFHTSLKTAGEDVLFFTALAAAAKRVGFDLDSCVECGGGLNMYFGNLSWDSPPFLAIKVDQLLAHRLVAKMVPLSPANTKWNDRHVNACRRELAFHVLRLLLKRPAAVPKPLWQLICRNPIAALPLPIDVMRAAMRAGLGRKQSK